MEILVHKLGFGRSMEILVNKRDFEEAWRY
jgi:hypothetical protein